MDLNLKDVRIVLSNEIIDDPNSKPEPKENMFKIKFK
jgi:hypothetical protein